jgi:hypothetical protein
VLDGQQVTQGVPTSKRHDSDSSTARARRARRAQPPRIPVQTSQGPQFNTRGRLAVDRWREGRRGF